MEYILVFTFLVSGLLEIAIPLFLGLYLRRRFGVSWKVFCVGGVLFLISLVRIPLNNAVNMMIYKSPAGLYSKILMLAFPAMTAGVFEEVSRYLAFRSIVKDHSVKNGLMYGAGHGGTESIIIAGLNVTTIGLLLAFAPSLLPPNLLIGIASMPTWMPFVGLYERLLAMVLQVSLSLIVLLAFIKNSRWYLVAAILLHFLVNFLTLAIMSSYGIFWTETAVTFFAVLIGATAWKLISRSHASL